jgi:hypothetical protein
VSAPRPAPPRPARLPPSHRGARVGRVAPLRQSALPPKLSCWASARPAPCAGSLSLSTCRRHSRAGILSVLANKQTPGNINALGLVLLLAAAGLVFAVPDDSTALVVSQAAGAVVLAGAGVAAFVGASILASFQK